MRSGIRTIVVGLAAPLLAPAVFAPDPAWSQTTSQAPWQPGGTAGASLAPGQIDIERSRVFVKFAATGFGHEHGVEGKLMSGVLRLSAASGAGRLVFDLRSFAADTAAARKFVGLKGITSDSNAAQMNASMLGSAVLDTANHPTATYEIETSQLIGMDKKKHITTYLLDGMFTLHGVKRPLRVEAHGESKGEFVHLTGKFMIAQSDYRIKPFSKLLGAVGVKDQLTIFGDLLVRAAPGPPPG